MMDMDLPDPLFPMIKTGTPIYSLLPCNPLAVR